MKKQVIAPIGVRAVGAGGLQHPPPPAPSNFGQLRYFGQQERFGQTKFLQKFPCFVSYFFFFERVTFYFILENEQKRYAIFRRVRRLGHTTVSELLMAIQNKVLFDTFPHFSE